MTSRLQSRYKPQLVYMRLATMTANFIYYVHVLVYNTFHIPVLFLTSLLYQSSLIINQHAILPLKWLLQRKRFYVFHTTVLDGRGWTVRALHVKT